MMKNLEIEKGRGKATRKLIIDAATGVAQRQEQGEKVSSMQEFGNGQKKKGERTR